ncbi:MAG: SpoIIE family protein phosphatase [Hyphomicrobiales bacterium]|nr:SpoIIE family protein phosphatase [Hyphomicrobiales bacterium]
MGQLSAGDLEALARDCTIEVLAPGDAMVRQGAASDSVYLILEGDVDVLVETAYGAVHLARLGSGAVVGDVGVFTGVPRTASVIASAPVRALRFASEQIISAGDNSPRFMRAILAKLGRHVATYNNAIGFYTNALSAIEQDSFDLRLLDDLMQPAAELVSFAETFRRMARQVTLRQESRKEMASAATIQRAFLPNLQELSDLRMPVDIDARMLPAKDVGGDFYDVFLIDDEMLAVTIGDVCGKGVPAALFMAVTQSVLRLVLRQAGELAARIGIANDLIVSLNKESLFATTFCAVIHLPSGRLTCCNCGHNAPLFLRNGQAALDRIVRTGPPLGMLPGARYTSRELDLSPGDGLILFTDGVTEAMDLGKQLYGDARLTSTVEMSRASPARELVGRIFNSVDAFVADAPQSDDITCLAVRYVGRQTVGS